MIRKLLTLGLTTLLISSPLYAEEKAVEEEAVQETKSIDSFGTLSGSDAFKNTLWKGTGRPIVEELFPKLPSKTSSTTLKALISKLAQSTTEPPQGEGTPGLLFTSRVEHLVNVGEGKAALEMLNILPDELMDDKRKMLKTKASLIELKTGDACDAAAEYAKEKTDQAFWNEAKVFCLAVESGAEKANEALPDYTKAAGKDTLICCNIKMADVIAGLTGGETKPGTIPSRASAVEKAFLKKAGWTESEDNLAAKLEPYASFVTVSDAGATFNAAGIQSFLGTKTAESKPQIAPKALVLMESMGEKVPPALWQKVKPVSPAKRGSNAFEDMLWNMDKAAYAGRQGETILYALGAIGTNGTLSRHPAIMGRIVNALKTVGLKKEASLLAAESLLD